MPSTSKEKKASKKHYDTDAKYRAKKIKDEADKHKANRPKYNKLAREYYKKNKAYREYKKKYSRDYKKTHKKSK